jgi:hypothetical protein
MTVQQLIHYPTFAVSSMIALVSLCISLVLSIISLL